MNRRIYGKEPEMTTQPCKHGHTEGRYRDGKCKTCSRFSKARWKAANQERVKASANQWYMSVRDERRAYVIAWRKANPELYLAQNARATERQREKRAALREGRAP